MKVKLLFTAALMTAASMATQNVFAGQGLSFGTALMASASPDGETEDVEITEELEDCTSMIINADCQSDAANMQAWVRNSLNASAVYLVGDDFTSSIANEGVYTGTGIEFWRGANSDAAIHNKNLISQTIYGVPMGKYRVTAYAMGRDQGAGDAAQDNMFFFANDGQVAVKSNVWTEVTVDATVDASGSLTIGLGGTTNWNNWETLSHVKLYALNNADALNSVIAIANEVKTSVNVENTTFDTAISTAEALGELATPANYKQAMIDLRAAIQTYLEAAVTETAPYDLSALLNKGAGWPTNSPYTAWTRKEGHTDNFAFSGTVAERWHETFDMYRTLKNLPNGKYEISIQAACSDNNKDFYLYVERSEETFTNLVANNVQFDGSGSDLDRAANFIQSNPTSALQTIKVNVTDGNLTIGLKATGNSSWCVWNQCDVKYLGAGTFTEEGGSTEELYAEYVQNAQAITGELPAAIHQRLQDALGKTNPTEADCNELRDAIDVANNAIAPYAAFKIAKGLFTTEFLAFRNAVIAPTEYSNAVSDESIAALNENVEKATAVETISQQTEQANKAYKEFIANVSGLANNVEKADVTFLVGNTTFEGTTAPWTNNVSGGHNFNVMNPNANVLGRDIRFIESYVYCDQVVNNANKKLVYQTLNGMPKGNYTFEAASFNRRANFGTANTAEDPNAIIMYVNNGKIEVNSTTFSETLSSVNGNSVDGTVEFGLASGENFNTDWNGLADVHLYYKGVPAVELSEESAYDVTEDTYANVTLNRTLKADDKWNTFCVPFDMPTDEFSAVKKLTAASTEGETTRLTFEDAASIEAGVPYIVKVNAEKTSLTANGVVVKAAAPEALSVTESQGNTISMLGNYATTTLNEGEFFISDNTFYIADRNVTVKGFRAYIKMDAAQTSEVNRMLIEIDGETTAIEDVMAGEGTLADKIVDVYTISGIKVKANTKMSEALNGLSKGIYIVDGKKIIK